jgi:hypothetical protein
MFTVQRRRVAEVVKLLTCTQEVAASHLGWHTSYTVWRSCSLPYTAMKCWHTFSNSPAPFHILPNLLFIKPCYPVFCGSLSPRHGASSGCGWRNGLRYGGQLRIHWISSRGQPTRGGPQAWGLGEVLTTPPREKNIMLCNVYMWDASSGDKTILM